MANITWHYSWFSCISYILMTSLSTIITAATYYAEPKRTILRGLMTDDIDIYDMDIRHRVIISPNLLQIVCSSIYTIQMYNYISHTLPSPRVQHPPLCKGYILMRLFRDASSFPKNIFSNIHVIYILLLAYCQLEYQLHQLRLFWRNYYIVYIVGATFA